MELKTQRVGFSCHIFLPGSHSRALKGGNWDPSAGSKSSQGHEKESSCLDAPRVEE